MELTEEVHDLLQRFKVLSKQQPKESILEEKCFLKSDCCDMIFDEKELVDLSQFDVSDEETWLFHSQEASARCSVTDLKKWLYEDVKTPRELNFVSSPAAFMMKEMHNLSTKDLHNFNTKKIDTRTFTRPKKKTPRPSIEKYNEDLFNTRKEFDFLKDNNSLTEIQDFLSPLENSLEDSPLLRSINEQKIDLNYLPRKPLHFDLSQPTSGNIFDNILRGSDGESFQNMSPPSLVNSMSSSTFNNLMESSLIKNDPVLREIRDADYSDELIMDCQAPMFQSITESCSSLNSDTPENFLLKTMGPNFSGTFKKNTSMKDYSNEMKNSSSNSTFNEDFNLTFKRPSKDFSDEMKSSMSSGINLDITYKKDSFSDLSISDIDMNSSLGSADSLDVMSNMSSSSKGSNKMLNMAEVDAIIERQEQSLQIMSTPKPAKSLTKLWETELISPIVGHKEHLSESDLSSADEYATVRSSLSKVSSINSEKEHMITEDRTTKSLGNLMHKPEERCNPRSINTITKGLNNLNSNISGSLTNLRSTDTKLKGSYSNLKTMSSNLKGSYTNLKPTYSNLPHVTSTIVKRSDPNLLQSIQNETFIAGDANRVEVDTDGDNVFKVPLAPKDSQISAKVAAPSGLPSVIVKSQARPSGLPRPIGSTGIPRPVSKIPGPRVSSARSINSARSNVRITSRDGNY